MSTAEKTFKHVSYLWEDAKVPADPVGQLLIRSNWLGADLRITNFAGGNTSVKCMEKDPLTGEQTEVMWIKGSGGDLGTMKKSGLACIEMKKFFALKKIYRGLKHEDEMVGYLPHCTFNLVSTAASIDTPLHAFIPRPHVDHLHPDSIIAIAASKDGEKLTKEIFGGSVAWIPWQRPGFDLGLKIGECYAKHPGIKGIILGGHGLFSWGDTARACYESTLELIEAAAEFLAAKEKAKPAFGGKVRESLSPEERRAQAAKAMPVLRGLTSSVKRTIGHFRDDAAVLQFLESKDLQRLAATGTSCPDHFLRTKRTPLVMDLDPKADPLAERARLAAQFDQYRADYAGYYERCKHPDSPALRPPDPAIVLWPGVGMFSFAKDKPTARVAAEFYVNAINVMRGAETVSSYVAISEQEAFDIEYWALEEAKLKRMPPEAPLSRRVALVTGAGSGIGKAIAERLAKEGACVVVADMNEEAAKSSAQSIMQTCPERAAAVRSNVTDPKDVAAAFDAACLAFGGVDLLVNNAGLSISKSLVETTEKDWDLQFDVMPKGSFLLSQAAARCFDAQGISQEGSLKNLGGDVVYIVSKNALVAQPNNIAYGSAKAAQLHQMRLLAAELGPKGVRVNAVNPDAVVRGSGIFASGWGADRAKTYGISEDKLPAFYASRTLLNQEILPDDIALAVFALVGGQLSKSTGMTIPVDGGLAPAFQR
ncbi:MAG: bifunctional rhamnulose-1-phosphate aldolase/short-chain dehydrogenase [Planctomycetota bacterium]|nr:bifunctional rhamnulose-1-phosphate aldolase/short-chain dehydrogenase [Planctomycetota bacterium]